MDLIEREDLENDSYLEDLNETLEIMEYENSMKGGVDDEK